jgi:hypothetical protein
LDLTQLQDFADAGAAALPKALAGSSPEFAVKIRFKWEKPASLEAANEVMNKISPNWKFAYLSIRHIGEVAILMSVPKTKTKREPKTFQPGCRR